MRDELDYEDMIALAGMFRRWAFTKQGFFRSDLTCRR
jgi:hypothetical protein